MKFRNTFKAISLLVCALMLVSILPIMASAAEITDVSVAKPTITDGVASFDVNFTASVEVEQVTMLAVRGKDADIQSDDTIPPATDTSIVGIDQIARPENGTGKFTFKVDVSKFDTENNPNIYIKVGGTLIDKAIKAGVEPMAGGNEGPITVPVPDPIPNGVATIKAQDDAFGIVGAKVVVIDIASLLTDGSVPNDYKVVVKDTELRYNPTNQKFVGLPIIGSTALTSSDIVITKEARTTNNIVFGDLNNDDGVINTVDLTFLIGKTTDSTLALPNSDLSADVNGDGVINTVDLTFLIGKTTDTTLVFPADQ